MTIELPDLASQTEFNLRRWEEIVSDARYAEVVERIETDRFGNIIMSPPPGTPHSRYQGRIMARLLDLLPNGEAMPECAISTADGVRATDVAWASTERIAALGDAVIFTECPEICVEVISPSNRRGEIDYKMRLYFDAGAKEVWVCNQGKMSFFAPGGVALPASTLCPGFPKEIKLTR